MPLPPGSSCQKWQLGRREGLCAIEAKPPTHTGLVSHRHWPAIPRAGPGTGLLPQAPWATCWGGTCHIAPPGPPPLCPPALLPQTDQVSFLPLKCKSNSQVCVVCAGAVPACPPALGLVPLLCASPRGVGPEPGGPGRRQNKPALFLCQSRAGPGPQRSRQLGQALGKQAAGRPVTWTGSSLDVLCPDGNPEHPVWVGSGQGLGEVGPGKQAAGKSYFLQNIHFIIIIFLLSIVLSNTHSTDMETRRKGEARPPAIRILWTGAYPG